MIEIILSTGIKLFIAVVVTFLVSKLKYFKDVEKSNGKIMIIIGTWIYSVFSTFFFKNTYIMMFNIGFIRYIGLILGIVGLILCIVSNNEKNSESIKKNSKIKNENSKTNTDDINLF